MSETVAGERPWTSVIAELNASVHKRYPKVVQPLNVQGQSVVYRLNYSGQRRDLSGDLVRGVPLVGDHELFLTEHGPMLMRVNPKPLPLTDAAEYFERPQVIEVINEFARGHAITEANSTINLTPEAYRSEDMELPPVEPGESEGMVVSVRMVNFADDTMLQRIAAVFQLEVRLRAEAEEAKRLWGENISNFYDALAQTSQARPSQSQDSVK